MENVPEGNEYAIHQAIHQAAIATNFHSNVQPFLTNSHEHLKLRNHQPGVLKDIDDYFQNTATEVGRSILVPLPPNAGKSTMTALCMNLAGVGNTVPETGKRLRAMTLVPRRLALKQTLETYDWIAPHLNVEEFDSSIPPTGFDEVDVLVMTYKAAIMMSGQRWLELTKIRARS